MKKLGLVRNVFIVVCLSSAFAWGADHDKGPAERAGQKLDRAGEKTATYVEDSAITTTVKAEILKDPLLKSNQISVETKMGVVELTGVVDSQEGINRAVDIARRAKHVTSVKNNLHLRR